MDSVNFGQVMQPALQSIPKDLQAAKIVTFADLFCGIGGFHYAGASLGLQCVFASDIDSDACDQYEENFGIRPWGDIEQIMADRVPDHDILFGGFPCQPFSIIGNREGLADARGNLIWEAVRILREKQPKAFVLENVKQLATINGGKTIEKIHDALLQAGYVSTHTVLNALNHGLPQKRERVIIVGFYDDSMDCFSWPKSKKSCKPLSNILEDDVPDRYFVSERIRNSRHEKHMAKVTPSIWHENKGGNISSHPYSCALRAGASYNYLLVDGERRLTPREQLRLQGFPERFNVVGNDSQIRKQTGNAVPVPVVRAVIKEVLHAAAKNAQRIPEERAISA